MTTQKVNIKEIVAAKRAQNPDFKREFDRVHQEYQLILTLYQQRQSSGLSQKELSDRCGISQQALSRLERERHLPNLSTLIKLCDALGLQLTLTKKEEAGSLG
jgi:ribosome-binding protein aMBF1 (putative translation factor)